MAALGAAWALVGCGGPAATDGVEIERTTALMGTTLSARVSAADREAAIDAAGAAFAAVGRLEGLLSSWDSTTPLSRLNRAPVGAAVAVGPELMGLLLRAERLAEATGRAFEPAVGPLVDAWGLRSGGRSPSGEEIDSAVAAVRAGFEIDGAGGTVVRRHRAAWIDTGGFGKGAGLEAARRALEESGARSALLDLGGQALTLGSAPGGDAWRIGVAHPERRAEPILELRIGPGLSVATSGGSERPGHLLDPLTGSSLPSWGSVTVVSADPVEADALATALFVLGPDEALEWSRQVDDVGVLILEEPEDRKDGLRVRWNPAMTQWMDSASAARLGPGDGAAPQASTSQK